MTGCCKVDVLVFGHTASDCPNTGPLPDTDTITPMCDPGCAPQHMRPATITHLTPPDIRAAAMLRNLMTDIAAALARN